MLLFASSEQLKMLFSAETILMDGTFSACPKVFDQVYTIHSIRFEQCMWLVVLINGEQSLSFVCLAFPCVFGLLPNRFKSTYQFLFSELKAIAAQMNMAFEPKTIMSDFEPALMNVLKVEVIDQRVR